MIIKTAEPFFFPGGPNACLLVHGFTGAPKEMRWMGEYLAGQGHTVLGIRLFGHATLPEDLLRARWEDWLHSVEDGWHLLRGASERIFVMGLSLGGILSLIFASRFPVSGVVAISTPYALKDDPRLPYVELLCNLVPRVEKGLPDWKNLEAATDHVDYPYYPTRAIAELRDALAEMRAILPRVDVPTLLVHARGDSGGGGFDPDSMPKIHAQLGSADKEMLWLENSGHVVVREPERMLVFQAAAMFVERISASPDAFSSRHKAEAGKRFGAPENGRAPDREASE